MTIGGRRCPRISDLPDKNSNVQKLLTMAEYFGLKPNLGATLTLHYYATLDAEVVKNGFLHSCYALGETPLEAFQNLAKQCSCEIIRTKNYEEFEAPFMG